MEQVFYLQIEHSHRSCVPRPGPCPFTPVPPLIRFLGSGTFSQLPKLAVPAALPTQLCNSSETAYTVNALPTRAPTKSGTSSVPHGSLTSPRALPLPHCNYLRLSAHAFHTPWRGKARCYFLAQCLALCRCTRKVCYSPLLPNLQVKIRRKDSLVDDASEKQGRGKGQLLWRE